jgi:hypothetical protein
LYALRDLAKPLRAQLEGIDEERKALEAHLVATMPKSDGGAIGKKAKAVILVSQEPTVADRAALERYILKTKDFSLLRGALAGPAVKERWEAGKKVPGVEPFAIIKVSVTKL